MKNNFLLIAVLLLIIGITGCSQFNMKNYLDAKLFKKSVKGTVVANVAGSSISLQEIRDEMKYSLGFDYSDKDVERMISDPAVQKNYEDKVINQYLIIKSMIDNNMLNDKEFEQYLLISMKEALIKYNLYKTFFTKPENAKWKEVMVTSNEEVLAFYKDNRKFFDSKEVKTEDALIAIRQDIEKRKSELFLAEITNFQKNMIDDLKAKYKVDRVK